VFARTAHADLWRAWGATPVGRCAAYSASFLRAERTGDLLVFAAYMWFPIRAMMAGWRMREVPFPSLLAVTAAFIVFCGGTHLFKVLTGYYPSLLPVSLAVTLSTAAVSWAAVAAIEGAWRAMRDHLNGTGGVAAAGAARATRAYVMLGLTALSVLVAGAWGYRSIDGLIGQAELRRTEGLAMLSVRDAISAIRRSESAQRGYLIGGDPTYLADYRRESASARDLLARTPDSIAWAGGDHAGLVRDAKEKLAELDETIRRASAGDRAGAVAVFRAGHGRAFMQSIDARSNRMIARTMELADARTARFNASARSSMLGLLGAGMLAPVSVGLAVGAIRRAARRQAAAETLARTAVEIGQARANAAIAEKQAAQMQAQYEHAEAARAREDAERAREQLRQSADLMNALSHDLRTPLNGIAQNAQLGKISVGIPATPRDRLSDLFERIHSRARGMGELLDQFLESSRAQYGRPEPVSFGVGPLLAEVAQHVADLAAGKGLTLAVDCPADLVGRTDRKLATRILLNLLSNAVKYTERGGVTVRAAPTDTGFSVAVADTGIGIEPGKIPVLFRDFSQIGNDQRDPRKGFGLGLSMVRRMADSLGATVTVESRVGAGSTFTVEFPDIHEA
jgi:signal transduction histidine kinase